MSTLSECENVLENGSQCGEDGECCVDCIDEWVQYALYEGARRRGVTIIDRREAS